MARSLSGVALALLMGGTLVLAMNAQLASGKAEVDLIVTGCSLDGPVPVSGIVWQYSFKPDPFFGVIHLNITPGGWMHGICETPLYKVPMIGKYEAGMAYFAVDLLAGEVEMFFLAITIATRDGYMMRISDDLSLIGPDYVELVPVTAQHNEGTNIDEPGNSPVTPSATYDFRINPLIDIVHLNTDLAPWLWGWQEAPHPAYPAPVLGYYTGGKFYFAADFIEGQGPNELALFAGQVATRDGHFIRATCGLSHTPPEYIWFTPP